jgi:hypothetical protein
MSKTMHCCYQVYILRAWQERASAAGQEAVWRFSLEDTLGTRRVGFSRLDGLMDFLQMQIANSLLSEVNAPPEDAAGLP